MVLTEVARFIFSSNYLSAKTSYSTAAVHVGGISFSVALMIAFVFACLLTVGPFLVFAQDRHRTIHSGGCSGRGSSSNSGNQQ